jgi:cyclophilin family peptidyl-prolyl cis-trans isomerase
MQKSFLLVAALLLTAPVQAEDAKPVPSPGEIAAAAPKADWTAIAPADLLVMDLTPDAKGRARRVVIQLMPAPFSQGWIGNIRKLAAAQWWDGLSINRVQDNYVVQWGDADAEDKAKARALPPGLVAVPESEYVINGEQTPQLVREQLKFLSRFIRAEMSPDHIDRGSPWNKELPDRKVDDNFIGGWPFSLETRGPMQPGTFAPVHCYGMVGVGRDLSPNTGTGAELYTVIGHAPRHLDRNIALVGRVIEGIEHLSSLPRGTGALGFYETAEERTRIASVRIGTAVAGLPSYEYLSTESASFAAYADARANRRDPFFIRPAGGADICNIPVPVRRVK